MGRQLCPDLMGPLTPPALEPLRARVAKVRAGLVVKRRWLLPPSPLPVLVASAASAIAAPTGRAAPTTSRSNVGALTSRCFPRDSPR